MFLVCSGLKLVLECFVCGLFLHEGTKLSPAGSVLLRPLSDIVLHSVQKLLEVTVLADTITSMARKAVQHTRTGCFTIILGGVLG